MRPTDCEGISDIRSELDYRKIHPLDHLNGFTRDSLRSIAERAGFEVIRAPAAHVTTDPLRIVKTCVKQLVQTVVPPTTRLYFKLRSG